MKAETNVNSDRSVILYPTISDVFVSIQMMTLISLFLINKQNISVPVKKYVQHVSFSEYTLLYGKRIHNLSDTIYENILIRLERHFTD